MTGGGREIAGDGSGKASFPRRVIVEPEKSLFCTNHAGSFLDSTVRTLHHEVRWKRNRGDPRKARLQERQRGVTGLTPLLTFGSMWLSWETDSPLTRWTLPLHCLWKRLQSPLEVHVGSRGYSSPTSSSCPSSLDATSALRDEGRLERVWCGNRLCSVF